MCSCSMLQPRIGIWQHTRKTKREIPVHKIFSRKGILLLWHCERDRAQLSSVSFFLALALEVLASNVRNPSETPLQQPHAFDLAYSLPARRTCTASRDLVAETCPWWLRHAPHRWMQLCFQQICKQYKAAYNSYSLISYICFINYDVVI